MGKHQTRREVERCDRCGQPAVARAGEEVLCAECYQQAGSCCPEFGGEDLWELEEKPAKPKAPEGDRRDKR